MVRILCENSLAGFISLLCAGAFLSVHDQHQDSLTRILDMTLRFKSILLAEQRRMQESQQNTSPSSRFARTLPPATKTLDRYVNIYPWVNNRVKLQVPEGKLDYINASPIVLSSPFASHESRPPLRYIAMQGPMVNTVGHAWRMVAEQLQSPAVIVMLTETHDAGFEKCFPYFPYSPEDKPLYINDEFGDGFRATVRCAEIEERAGGAIVARRLELDIEIEDRSDEDHPVDDKESERGSQSHDEVPGGNTMSQVDSDGDVNADAEDKIEDDTHGLDQMDATNGETKRERKIKERRSMTVWHLLYRRWPDFGAPAMEDIGSFFQLMRLSREKNASADNPRVIHCSAGVGRSGTFMALEHLVRELESGDLENYDRDYGTIASLSAKNGSVAGPIGPDLVLDTVNKLREQRRMMVQAESQLHFIYTVLHKLWMDRYGVSATPTGTAPGPGGQKGNNGYGHGDSNGNQNGNRHAHAGGNGSATPVGGEEPAAKRLEIDLNDPFVED